MNLLNVSVAISLCTHSTKFVKYQTTLDEVSDEMEPCGTQTEPIKMISAQQTPILIITGRKSWGHWKQYPQPSPPFVLKAMAKIKRKKKRIEQTLSEWQGYWNEKEIQLKDADMAVMLATVTEKIGWMKSITQCLLAHISKETGTKELNWDD